MKRKDIWKKLFVANILVLYIMTMIFTPLNELFAYEISEYKSGINEFPESYKLALNELKKQHPNWEFVAVYTNLDFDYVVSQEMRDNVSLISKSAYSSEWKRDDKDIEPGWVNASEKAVRYFLDPRNFLNEEKIFQFESTKFNENAHTTDIIEKVLSGYGLANKNYYINNNEKIDMETKYSDVIYTAGKENNVSPVHLASRIIQETGGTIGSIKEDGSVKSKGAYVKKLSMLDNDLPIVNKAIKEKLINNIDVETTINNAKELIDFQKCVKITGKYSHALHNNKEIDLKVVRVFASLYASDSAIMKIKPDNRLEKIANTADRVFIDNDNIIGKDVPYKLDKSWYISLAKDRIDSFIEENNYTLFDFLDNIK